MKKTIASTTNHFAVYEHPMVNEARELSRYRAFVVSDSSGRPLVFSGLELYSHEYEEETALIQVRRKQELNVICNALNTIFAENNISKIEDVTSKMIFKYFDDYCDSKLTKRSCENRVRAVSYFFANLANDFPSMKVKVKDLLYTDYVKKNKESKKVYREYRPKYIVHGNHPTEKDIFRDLPLRVAQRLLDLAYIHDPMIAFPIAVGMSTGLRGSCVCNMRQKDSPVSDKPGINIGYAGKTITGIQIDMTETYNLRADGKPVGGIKKKRNVSVYSKFIPEFYAAYQKQLKLLSKYNVDPRYKPMIVDRNGQAMTYSAYRYRLQKLVKKRLIPQLLNSNNPEDVVLGMTLQQYSLGTHVFRHVFTVRLVLAGLDVAQIMEYRGDKSPQSALAYLAKKGDLISLLEETHEKVITELGKGGVVLYGSES